MQLLKLFSMEVNFEVFLANCVLQSCISWWQHFNSLLKLIIQFFERNLVVLILLLLLMPILSLLSELPLQILLKWLTRFLWKLHSHVNVFIGSSSICLRPAILSAPLEVLSNNCVYFKVRFFSFPVVAEHILKFAHIGVNPF